MARNTIIVILAFLLISCQPVALTASKTQPTETLVPTETPSPIPTATQTLTPTVIPTPTTSPLTLEQQAAELCDRAFSTSVQAKKFDMPYLGMLKTERDRNPSWRISNSIPHLFALSAESVKSIICSLETRRQAGIYTDGSAAFVLTMNIRVVSWPDGAVVASQTYESGNPPKTKTGIGGGYGIYPDGKSVRDWVLGQVEHPMFLNDHGNVTVAPSGRIAATTFKENEVMKILLFDWLNLDTIATLENNDLVSIIDLAFSPDGDLLVSVGTDGLIRFWDMQTYQQTQAVQFEGRARKIAFAPDGQTIALSTDDSIHLIRIASREIYQSFPSNTLVKEVAFSLDSKKIFTNGPLNDEMGITLGINVRDTETGQQISLLPDMSSAEISISPEGHLSFDVPFPTGIHNFVLSPDGSTLISYNSNESPERDLVNGLPMESEHILEIWDANTGQYLFNVPYIGLPAKIIVYSPDGNFFAVGESARISIWDAKTWSITKKLIGHLGDISDLAFTTDTSSIISTSTDGTLRVWYLQE